MPLRVSTTTGEIKGIFFVMKEFKQNESKKHDAIQIWCYENAEEIFLSFSKNGLKKDDLNNFKVSIEKPIIKITSYSMSSRRDIVGYIDVQLSFDKIIKYEDGYTNTDTICVNIEIKPYIHSLGDLIRQVKTYKHEAGGVWVVMSPDDRYVDILRSQGILFYKSPEL